MQSAVMHNCSTCSPHVTMLRPAPRRPPAAQRGNQAAKTQYQERMAQVWRKHDCNPLKSMASIFVQVPLFIGFFGAIRSMATAQVSLWYRAIHGSQVQLTLQTSGAEGFKPLPAAMQRQLEWLTVLLACSAPPCMQVPSLTHGGALWFTDLTVADPTYALPVLCSAMILLTVELGAADGMQVGSSVNLQQTTHST